MNLAYNDYLQHHGIKGQKWGVRRYQNPDGSLTDDGMKRYSGRKKDLKYIKRRTKYEMGVGESEVFKEERSAHNNKKAYNKALKSGNAEKALYYAKEYENNLRKIAYKKALIKVSLDKLSDMSSNDISNERYRKGKESGKTALKTLGSIGVATLMASAIGFGVGPGVTHKTELGKMYDRLDSSDYKKLDDTYKEFIKEETDKLKRKELY